MTKLFICLLLVAVAYGLSGPHQMMLKQAAQSKSKELTAAKAYRFANTDGKWGITSEEFDAYWPAAKAHIASKVLEGACSHDVTTADFAYYLKDLTSILEELAEEHDFEMPEHGFEHMDEEEMAQNLDINKNGKIDCEEFEIWIDQVLTLTGRFLKDAMFAQAIVPRYVFVGALEYAEDLTEELMEMTDLGSDEEVVKRSRGEP